MIAAARSGEPAALGALGETARYLTIGASNIVLALNPQTIVVAGRLTESQDPGERRKIKEELARMTFGE